MIENRKVWQIFFFFFFCSKPKSELFGHNSDSRNFILPYKMPLFFLFYLLYQKITKIIIIHFSFEINLNRKFLCLIYDKLIY